MTREERFLMNYRMSRAREALEEAQLLFNAGHINYACFYAVSALLLSKGMSTSKHGHLRSLLHREFVKKGSIPKELGKHFDLLFDSRQESDYADLVDFEPGEVCDWLDQTDTFVSHIENLISELK
jgi:uncharacterized protein (UPF0332 family)